MDTGRFLRTVLGTAGSYCIWAARDGKRVQKFYDTIEKLQAAAENLDQNEYDVYFAIGTFKDPSIEKPREATNVEQMRSFFMDLDCGHHIKTGKPKEFPDQETAIRALKEFVKRNDLPRPFLVNSGYGVHVYWPLATPVDYDTWLPVAEALKALAKAQGFRADPNVTADGARILRVPGTHNRKAEEAREVSFFGVSEPIPVQFTDMASRIERVAPTMATVSASSSLFGGSSAAAPRDYTPASGTSAMMDALMGKRESSFKMILDKSRRGVGCAQLVYCIKNRATLDEPMWRAALSIAAHCSDRTKAISVVSAGHPGYDEDEAEWKAKKIRGPYTCGTFEEHNPGGCDGCPNLGKIKSPIVLGHQIKEADPEDNIVEDVDEHDSTKTKVYTIPPYPQPYFRGANGGVFLRTKDEEGEIVEKMIWHNDLYVTRRLNDAEMGEIIEMRHHLPRDGVRTFVVPLYTVTSKEEFRKILSTYGVIAINKEVDAIMTYTQASVKELQFAMQADEAHRQFGWVGDFTGFVIGDKVLYPDRVEFNAPSSATRSMMEYFTPKGTLEGWKEAVDFYNKPGFELHQFITCTGFGSVLMRFMPVKAAMIHLWSKESGFGKTHAQFAALSPWGNPDHLILQERDTQNSRMNRADVMHSLPVCMDEVTNMSPKDASDLIYQITGGKQKNRMSSSGNMERVRGEPWNLLFVTSANCSMIDKVAMAKMMPKAEAQRMLEIETSRLFNKKSDKQLTDQFSRAIQSNYGHAGPIFIDYVMKNLAETKLLLETLQRKIDEKAELGPENRFWSAAATVTLAAAVICKHLGLINYDVNALHKYIVTNILRQNKMASKDMSLDPMDLVTSYTYENLGRILQIRSTIDRRKKGFENGLDDLVTPDQNPKGIDIVGRYETDLQVLYLLPAPFRDWLADRQINYNSVAADLKSHHGAIRNRVRLTKGTKLALPAADVLQIPIQLEDTDGKEV